MEDFAIDIVSKFGITGIICLALYFIIKEMLKKYEAKNDDIRKLEKQATEHRKEERDLEIRMLKNDISLVEASVSKHITRHQEYEKNLCGKIDKLYERLNPLCDAVNKIQGYMEAKNDRGS